MGILINGTATKSIFFEKYNVTTGDLESYLSEALSRGGDYADLYFEYRINHSIVLEEQIIKSATKGVNLGVGVRVISGEKTGYAYSDDLNRERISSRRRARRHSLRMRHLQAARSHVPSPLNQERNSICSPRLPGGTRDRAEDRAAREGGSGCASLRSPDQTGSGELRR